MKPKLEAVITIAATFPADFGRRVKEKRKQWGRSVKSLASEVGISRSTWIKIEGGDGRVTYETLRAIADLMQIGGIPALPNLKSRRSAGRAPATWRQEAG